MRKKLCLVVFERKSIAFRDIPKNKKMCMSFEEKVS